MTAPTTAHTTSPGRVDRLAEQAADAAAVRALTTHPDVIALRVERVRSQVDALLWAGIVLGLAFTMVNVQTFAAGGADRFTAAWWVAWLLDPMVSLVLLAVLRAEQVTARYQVTLPAWGRRTKWLTFAATYVMNTWTSWGLAGTPLSWSGVVLHSVPPLVVFATAETGPGLRDRLTEAVRRALTEHTAGGSTGGDAAAAPTTNAAVHEQTDEPVREPVTEPAPAAPARPAARRTPRRTTGPVPRRLLADYLTDARAALDAAHAAGELVEPSPTWCRQVTGCSAGTSVKLAAALRTDQPALPVPTAVPSDLPSRNSRPGAGEEVAA
ncbi:hypothetical protein [Pseudonocardia dioxanivorans]|uniref:hypothetical protein n=1 Tax=Pseudonocardia dioxanivorans TaxID=240495 RepID=UPI000CD28895|nr:hypothetical protein [Pseudonocardia dioxanivorans]